MVMYLVFLSRRLESISDYILDELGYTDSSGNKLKTMQILKLRAGNLS